MGSIVKDGQLTASHLELYFKVVPETGEIFSIKRSLKNGERIYPAGFIKPGGRSSGGGYRIINVPVSHRVYKKLRAHHLVWLWFYGEWFNDGDMGI